MASSDETSTYGCVHCGHQSTGLSAHWSHMEAEHPETIRRAETPLERAYRLGEGLGGLDAAGVRRLIEIDQASR